MLKRLLGLLGNVLGVIGALLAAFTFLPWFVVFPTFVLAVFSRFNRRRLLITAVTGVAAFGLRIATTPTEDLRPPTQLPQNAGQYSARSHDLLGLVSVRAVIRSGTRGPVLVFVEANTLPFSGLDEATLEKQIHRSLEAQGVPPARVSEDDSLTTRLFRSALAKALGPNTPAEAVECPKGISAPETFWSMYPAEFSHSCRVSGLSNGRYWGQSTAEIPVTARLDVRDGVIQDIVFQGPLSPYGQRAAEAMRERMIGGAEIGVDVVSGATQTAYAVRSAAHAACRQASRQEKAVSVHHDASPQTQSAERPQPETIHRVALPAALHYRQN